jgi:phospholipid/cholesterol/gamma-HCH transport system substrate-binding protein
MQADLKASLANIHAVTDNATRISVNVERFSSNLDHVSKRIDDVSDSATATLAKTQADVDLMTKRVNDRLEQVARLLETFQSISAKIDKGQGTAGLLVNDSKLYQSLADTSQELKATVTDLKLLIEQWTQEGVTLRMNNGK